MLETNILLEEKKTKQFQVNGLKHLFRRKDRCLALPDVEKILELDS